MKRQHILILAGVVVVGAGIALASSMRGKGTLVIEGPGAELVLRNGWFSTTTLTSKSGPVQVQAGIYHPVRASITLAKKDDPAQWWSLSSTRGPWGKLAAIRVDKGQTVTLRFGPPITLRADLQQSGGTVSAGLRLVGQAGEEWTPSIMTSDGRAAPPGVRILDESGKVLAEGQFRYG